MALTENEKKQNTKWMNIYMGVIAGVILCYIFGYAGSLMDTEGRTLFTSVRGVWESVREGTFFFPITRGALIGMGFAILIAAFLIVLMQISSEQNYSYAKDAVSGTGGFMTKKQHDEYDKKYVDKKPYIDPISEVPDKKANPNMILSDHFFRNINDFETRKNNNIVVFGGAGTGKSRFVIKPNILQLNASFLITDPSGEILSSLGNVLKEDGYVIKIFNISDMNHSNQYNPLHYIRDEAGVLMLIDCLIKNTSDEGSASGDNKFFVDAERLLYAACIFFLRDEKKASKDMNFSTVFDMINKSNVDEMNSASTKSELDEMFDTIKNKENSLAWKYYSAFKQAAGRTLKAIIISCVVRLQYFQIPQVKRLTERDDMELDEVGNRKTALFVITPQADRTYSFLAAMLYSQFFEVQYYHGEERQREGESTRTKYHIRCLMDEFANIGEIPAFPAKISTMRKYNISVTIILQDKSQIEAMYEDEWKTITANCDSWIFLGSNEPETLKYIAEEKLGYQTITSKSRNTSLGKGHSSRGFQQTKREVMTAEELGRLPVNECIVFTGAGEGSEGIRPVRDKKYDYTRHPLYKETGDGGGKERAFEYAKISLYDVKKTSEKALSTFDAMDIAVHVGGAMEEVSMDDLTLQGMDAALDNMEYSEDMIQFMFARITEIVARQIQSAQEGFGDHPMVLRITQVEAFPPRLLSELVRKVSVELNIPSLIIFADNNGRRMCGCGIAIPTRFQEKISAYFADGKEEYLAEADGQSYQFKIEKERYGDFENIFAA